MTDWQTIETAPKDGTKFWGAVGDDAIAMLWHPTFRGFVSSWSRMTLANGMTFSDTGKSFQDHHPVIHHPLYWMPLQELPK